MRAALDRCAGDKVRTILRYIAHSHTEAARVVSCSHSRLVRATTQIHSSSFTFYIPSLVDWLEQRRLLVHPEDMGRRIA
jgi:hypothetical protein